MSEKINAPGGSREKLPGITTKQKNPMFRTKIKVCGNYQPKFGNVTNVAQNIDQTQKPNVQHQINAAEKQPNVQQKNN